MEGTEDKERGGSKRFNLRAWLESNDELGLSAEYIWILRSGAAQEGITNYYCPGWRLFEEHEALGLWISQGERYIEIPVHEVWEMSEGVVVLSHEHGPWHMFGWVFKPYIRVSELEPPWPEIVLPREKWRKPYPPGRYSRVSDEGAEKAYLALSVDGDPTIETLNGPPSRWDRLGFVLIEQNESLFWDLFLIGNPSKPYWSWTLRDQFNKARGPMFHDFIQEYVLPGRLTNQNTPYAVGVETVTISARSFPEAMSKAGRGLRLPEIWWWPPSSNVTHP